MSRSNSQEAFLSITLCTVLLMSFVTEGIGLSGTLGAFLAGLLLAETRYYTLLCNVVKTHIFCIIVSSVGTLLFSYTTTSIFATLFRTKHLPRYP